MKNLIVVLFSLCLCATAADTKPLLNRDGNCTVMIPSSWSADDLGGAQSPDKKVSIVVSSPKHGLTSMSDVAQIAPTIYTADKVTKSTGSEFEMAGNGINGKPNFYRAIPAAGKLCIAEITYESGTATDAKAIVETLKAK